MTITLLSPVGSAGTLVSPPNGSGANDTGKIVDALTAAANKGYGRVSLQDGVYSVAPDQIKLPTKTQLLGMGDALTEVRREGDGCLIDVSGTSYTAKTGRTLVGDMYLNGKNGAAVDTDGPLYRGYHVFEAHVKDLRGKFSLGAFIDLANAWDCAWKGYIFNEWCGTKPDGTQAAVAIRSHNATSGFGFGNTDVTNMIKLLGHLRTENFRRGLVVERGGPDTGDLYGIHLPDLKFETSIVKNHFLRAVNVNDIRIDYCDITGNAKDAGVSGSGITPIFWSPLAQGVLEQVRAYTPAANIFFNLIQSFHGSNGRMGNIRFDGPGGPSSGFVMDWQSATAIDVGVISSQVGLAEDGGTRPPLPGSSASVAGAATTMKVPDGDVITVTGAATITTIPVVRRRRIVTFLLAGATTMTDGGNLKLNGNLVAKAGDTMVLECDGTNWNEIARSVN